MNKDSKMVKIFIFQEFLNLSLLNMNCYICIHVQRNWKTFKVLEYLPFCQVVFINELWNSLILPATSHIQNTMWKQYHNEVYPHIWIKKKEALILDKLEFSFSVNTRNVVNLASSLNKNLQSKPQKLNLSLFCLSL